MNLARSLTILLLLLLMVTNHSVAQETVREVIVTEDSDYYGFDLQSEKDVTLEECKTLCVSNNQCRAFTYNTKVSWCFLKSDFDKIVTFKGAVAGKVVEVSNEPDLGAPPKLELLPAGMQSDVIAELSRIAKIKIGVEAQSARSYVQQGLQSLFSNNANNAVAQFRTALRISDSNPKIWFEVANSINRWLNAGNRNYQVSRLAMVSAIGFYRRTRTLSPRVEALAAIAASLNHQRQYQAAIGIYKKSLELKPTEKVRVALAKLRSENGFRVIGNSVQADLSSPKACIDFAFDLAQSNINYEDYVSVEGASEFAVVASSRQLCVTNLKHGKSYAITLRSGLPSNFGEVLEFPTTINTYIRDRSPTVRFDGNKFVIANAARQAIPIVGINAESADIELFRIGDRALSTLLSGSDFLNQLSDYQINRLGDDLGERVWKGSLSLEVKRNEEAITAFPVSQALPARKPGIYVLTASAVGSKANSWEAKATQWFVISDIGLITYAGNDGLTVFANSLDGGQALQGAEIKLLARNNEVLGIGNTDINGKANFPPGLMRGTAGLSPTVLIAQKSTGNQSDFMFLDLTRSGFDLSDRGVEGRPSPGPLDTYSYLDRGIYRPGETVNLVSMVRDEKGVAQSSIPITTILWRPDNVEAAREVSTKAVLGSHVMDFQLPENAMRGTWRLAVHSDPATTPLSETKFLVEDFQPDRIEFDLKSDQLSLAHNATAQVRVDGTYLYGAPAQNLTIEGEVRFKSTEKRSDVPGYQFGLTDEKSEGVKLSPLQNLPQTDSNGLAEFPIAIDQELDTNKPAVAEVVVRMLENGGRPVERILTIPIKPNGPMIGIRPGFEDNQVAEGSTASFNIIAVDPSGTRIDQTEVDWALYRLDRNYQWYRGGGGWYYEAVVIPELVQQGNTAISKDDITEISAQVDWGRYRLDVISKDIDGPASSIQFEAGWYVDAATTETPDALEIALDKASYQQGDIARLKVSPKFGGELLIAIGTDSIQKVMRTPITVTGSEIEIPVDENWGAGTYLTATLVRPGSVSSKRMPARAIGTTWMTIDPVERKLSVKLELPEKVQPNTNLTIPVEVTGTQADDEIFVTLAAVDVGILNLTGYNAPNPSNWYFSQRALGLEIRDLYGNLIDGSQGNFGRIRSGGDGPGLTAQGSPPTQKLLSLFSGPVRLDANGRTTISFNLPQFNGTARVMAVAWTNKAIGQADQEVIIRDPVTISASIPKVLAPQDTATSILELFNGDLEASEFELSASADAFVSMKGLPNQITLKKGETKSFRFELSANSPGAGDLEFVLEQNGEPVSRVQQSVQIRPAELPVITTLEFPLSAHGGSVTIDGNILGDSYLQNATLSVNVSKHRAFDVSSLLMRLDKYPYGCAEQTTSRALPLLYLSDLSQSGNYLNSDIIQERIQAAIDRIITFQSASGGFGLWGPGEGDMWLDAYITDFLTRAREKGHTVPALAMRLAVQNLQNQLGYQTDITQSGDGIAYAIYVLARNKMASASDLRYYADTQIQVFESPLARGHLAAALSLYNENERTSRTFTSAIQLASSPQKLDWSDDNYGSSLRNKAAILALATEANMTSTTTDRMLKLVGDEFARRTYTSTQENAWLLLAARAVQEADKTIQLEVNGSNSPGAFSVRYSGSEISSAPITLRNTSPDQLIAVVTKTASPKNPLPANGNGFAIERKYYRLDGTEADLNEVRQNERFVVVLSVTQFNNSLSRILVSDLLPGGFEIDNPSLISGAKLENFKWLGQTEVAHSEFRDDRFVTALNRNSGDARNFNLAYVVRAVSPGSFTHPAASVEDMYRPEWQARTASGFLQISPGQK